MSAINVLIQSNSVHLITDGAMRGPDGAVTGVGSKVFLMPELQAAFSWRGQPIFGGFLWAIILATKLQTAAELKQNIAEIVKETEGALSSLLVNAPAGGQLEIVVAGIIDDKPGAFFIANHDGPAFTAGKVVDLVGLSNIPFNRESQLLLHEQILRGRTKTDELDPVSDGREILEIQRKMLFPIPGGRSNLRVPVVGGFGQLTSIKHDSIETRVISEWKQDRRKSHDTFACRSLHDAWSQRSHGAGAATRNDREVS